MTQHKAITTRLDIVGFKSFADEVHLDILPGLTGIVGPNGCGKSNIVEALRWTMGESSARALRGGESDDLIFAGTGSRPARNLARVTLHLGAAAGLAPPPFQQSEELEVSRQAERGAGSTYRINNRVMRAKDVQTIFADLSSGARSSSIISQNRVSQLIAAKPEERRLLLEEAAGITGLHVRRRDAELKLRQAESNLERAEEHRRTLDQQLSSLSTQSEQAQRYRQASEDIRQHERSLLILQHARAEELVQSRRAALEKAKEALARNEQALLDAKKHVELQAEKRQQESEALATLRQRLEQYRIHVGVAEAALQHMQQASADHARQRAQLEDDLARQKKELSQLEEQQAQTRLALEQIMDQQRATATKLPALEETITALQQTEATQRADHAALSSRYQDGTLQHERLQSRQQELARQIADDRENLNHLEIELQAIEQDCTREAIADQLRQQVSASMEEASSCERNAREAEAHFQEQRLLTDRTQRDLHEARTRLEQLQQREKELTQAVTRQQSRLETERTQKQEIRHGLLDKTAEERFQAACQTTRTLAEQTALAEKGLIQKREQAEQLWLSEQAALEKCQQRREFLQQDVKRLTEQLADQQARSTAAQAALKDALDRAISIEELDGARTRLNMLAKQINSRLEAITQTEEQHNALLEQEKEARQALQQIETDRLRYQSEHEGLQSTLQGSILAIPHPVLEQLEIPDALIRAVASALTDGLEASLPPEGEPLTDTPRQWRPLPPLGKQTPAVKALAALPSLASLINIPAPLERAFRAIFLLEKTEDGPALHHYLQPGQALVTKEGGLWRWDGFIRQPNTPTAEMVRLQQAQALKKTAAAIQTLDQQHAVQKAAADTLHTQCETLAQALAEQRQSAQNERDEQARQKHQLEGLTERHAFQQEQISLLQQEASGHEAQQNRTKSQLAAVQSELKALPVSDKAVSDAAAVLQTIRDEEQSARLASEEARSQHQKAENERQQALFRNDALKKQLAERTQTIDQLEQDIRELSGQKQTVLDTQAKIDLPALQSALKTAEDALHHARQAAAEAIQKAETVRKEATRQEQALQERSRLLAGLQARRESLQQQIQTLKITLEKRLTDEAACQKNQSDLPDIAILKEELDRTKAGLTSTTDALQQHRADHNTLSQTLSLLKERHGHLLTDSQKQADRHAQLQTLTKDLTDRHAALMTATPEQAEDCSLARHEEQLQKDMETLRTLEEEEKVFTNHLAQTEATLHDQQALLDHHKDGSSRYREDTIRLGERAEQAEEALALLRHDSPLPDNAEAPNTVSADAEQALRQALKRALKRRDDLGPVNLCAEDEFQTAQKESERIAREHQDLSTAIARLRGGVGAINREGRQRLMAVFADINEHFQKLFTRMFGGGKAHLQMVGSDDPLEAGLEIFAQPPGKKLSTLSLLSGGEQALTALSLIFAAFHCTPAPICVLDEVDAPLDDANVERFCTLIRDITKETGTRFLVITHHQLTMAHMDRLYGITMQERGVSRLLSVNLDESIRMVNG
ncbi:chromosome segregation protein SMC [Parasaccharibacter sp. TMW 2.1884]|uniref:AAA family ATPase n=1 Tax=Parasaccharibacter sp. TMW 2.1884 TaxID=2267834 RepID=UPI001318B8E9|nr:AAA family ATPase [Parasaccharibacter sp. TMW 2.1884]MCL1511392.1 chromosome segregation protein SMC [Parasaccharibacter sp. TMW 2.1884]QGT75152.1 AAA family ATPase [Bombella sp. ESL0368]